MMKQKLLAIFDAVWLPLFLMASITWLFAPWLDGGRVGHLEVISVYEGLHEPLSWLFRTGDIVGALLLAAVVMRTGLLHRRRWLGLSLLGFGALVLIDVVFVIGCYHNCGVWERFSYVVHDIESGASLVLLALTTAIDVFRSKHWISRIFLLLQLSVGALLVAMVLSYQTLVLVQYIYQTAVVAWLAYVLDRYMPPRSSLSTKGSHVRSVYAGLLAFAGLLELTAAFHFRIHDQFHSQLPDWLASHSVISGATMLYVSRQILRGQRRAALIAAAILVTLGVKYALLTPHALPLAVVLLLLITLWYNWGSFNRNLGTPPIISRLQNLLVLVAGVVTAALLLFAVAGLAGHRSPLIQDFGHLFDASRTSVYATRGRGDRAERQLEHFRTAVTTLGVVLLAFTLYSIFRPARRLIHGEGLEPETVRAALAKYSNSSEDYFKLWPSDKEYFTDPGIDGFIAYKKVGGTVFSLADPICAPNQRRRLLREFADACREHGWSTCFLLVRQQSLSMYVDVGCKIVQIGSSAVVPVELFNAETLHDKWWRWQLNRSVKAGVTYQISQPPHSSDLLRETAEVSAAWLRRSGRGEQGFALGYYDESYLQQCRLHLLRAADGTLLAFTNQLPIYNHSRQATADLIRFRPEADGAMPVLMAHVIKSLHESNQATTFDLGFVPLAKLDNRLAAIARRVVASRYSAAGLERFKGKFKPDWQPQYLAYDGDLVDLTIVISRLETAMKAS